MNRIIRQNLRHYGRYYLLIALAVALANTIITGSLFVGDSVKQTLVSRVDERLGRTLTFVSSGSGFMDEAFAALPDLKGSAATIFLTNGFVPHNLSLLPVSVWGVDSSLTTIAAQDFVFPGAGELVINRKTAYELSLKAGDDIVIRLPNTRMIPSGSLFVTDNYTASLRLKVKAVMDSRQSGNLNLRNEQSLPFNLFINRRELASILEMEGKCNIILLNRNLSGDELSNSWNPAFSGITVESSADFQEIVSERVFLEEDLINRLEERFPQTNRLFSYLVNDISLKLKTSNPKYQSSIPYSFVTAIDCFAGQELTGNDMILSDYAARRINASAGDTVFMSFFVSKGLKELSEEQRPFIVRAILPLQMFHADGRLSADFPGLSNVDNCTDWDSDLPIDMSRIEKEDEDYWDLYRTTPKALIAYTEGASLWGNNYGVATAVRISGGENIVLCDILSPSDVGITIVSPRDTGLAAARSGVDFKSLFLALAFFVIAASLLLATIPLGGMLNDRRKELILLQALGYTRKRIQKILINEVAVLTTAAILAGMITAVLYNKLVLFALGNIWKGAVHTEDFVTNIEPVSLIIGSLCTLAVSFGALWWTLRKILKQPMQHRNETHSGSTIRWILVVCLVIMLVLIFINLFVSQSPALFMATGLTGLIATITGYAVFISWKASKTGIFTQKALVYKNLIYRRRNGIISVTVLAAGLFVVFSTGLNRKNFSDSSALLSGTGGYTLWGENSVPLYHSLSNSEGRERFGLSGLPADASILQFYRRGGDDASCLNLNKAPQPTVLGVDAKLLADASFTFAATLEIENQKSKNENIWASLSQKRGDYYPVIADQTVLQWGLMKSVGDTITYLNQKGKPVVLQFIGGLNNSIFQGNLLMSKEFFAEIWEANGSEVMLIQTSDSTKSEVKQILSHALANYGLQLTFCNERLKEFNSVTDSYLTIFMMLGGLGLLIGLFGMLLIIRRGLIDRAKEISTFSVIGFDSGSIKKQLSRESMLVPLYAIIAGTLSSLVAVTSAISSVSLFTWFILLAILGFLVIIAWWYSQKNVTAINKDKRLYYQ